MQSVALDVAYASTWTQIRRQNPKTTFLRNLY